MNRHPRAVVYLLVLFCLVTPTLRSQEDPGAATGAALSSILNVRRAPVAKGMGLFQASFLDALKQSSREMQLAVVIDSTESMTGELEAIRSNLPNLINDLYQIMDGRMELAVISYADIGAGELPAKSISRDFVNQLDSMQELVAQVKPESGKPYFPEAVDLGVFTAIDSLSWSAEDDVEKWILLIGDAPPYAAGFQDEDTTAKRWYSTDVLVALANRKKIKVNCLLCNSRQSEKSAFRTMLTNTQVFMSQLADETNGVMLDLSYPEVRKKLLEQVSRPRCQYERVGHISAYDIKQAAGSPVEQTESNRSLRIAVLPLLPIESMSFVANKPEVQLAAEIRKTVSSLNGIRAASDRQIEIALSRSSGGSSGEVLVDLCKRLNLDYVIHGSLNSINNEGSVVLQVFGRAEQTPLLNATVAGARDKLGSLSVALLRDASKSNVGNLHQKLNQVEIDQSGLANSLSMFVGLDEPSRQQLLTSFVALEQALGYSLIDPAGQSLLDYAEGQLKSFLKLNPDHAFGHVIYASCLFNQASFLEQLGKIESAKEKFRKSKASLNVAYAKRSSLIDPLTRLEIEGDYHLIVRRDVEKAVEAYQAIIEFDESSPVNSALRAHWVLAGIHVGDWNVATLDTEKKFIDGEKARSHLIQILANWPDSSEAETIRRNMLWDPERNKSRSAYVPRIVSSYME